MNKYDQIRVRFAPSPTGMPHLGNARAALINYIFAKQQNGKFLFRVEDTDVERSTLEFKNALFDTLKWLHITYDEDPIVQSARFEIYKNKAHELFAKNMAYYCKCEKLTDEHEKVICACKHQKYTEGVLRFKVPASKDLHYTDLVYGELSINTDNMEDFALLRSDGTPTYHLCVVIDDIESRISHVIRGEDHRTNTFKQMLLYNAMSVQVPTFAHLPMILGIDGKKLSKRNGGSSVEFFRSQGVDYRAMMNSMMRLGWSLNGQERLFEEEFVKYFNISTVLRKSAKLDIDKMYKDSQFFLKHDLLQNISHATEQFREFTQRYFEVERDVIQKHPRLYANAVEKSKTYLDLYNYTSFLYEHHKVEIPTEDIALINEYIKNNNIYFQNEFTIETADKIIKDMVAAKLHKALRLVIMSSKIGCDLTESLYAIGNNEFLKRIDAYIQTN